MAKLWMLRFSSGVDAFFKSEDAAAKLYNAASKKRDKHNTEKDGQMCHFEVKDDFGMRYQVNLLAGNIIFVSTEMHVIQQAELKAANEEAIAKFGDGAPSKPGFGPKPSTH